MDRLTKVTNGVCTYVGPGHKYNTGDLPVEMGIQEVRTALSCLAAYEDTGLEPEEILDFVKRFEWAAELAGLVKQADIIHLKELLRADMEGRLMVQPPNPPLTLEDLREMDGEPVHCVNGSGNQCWCLVNCDDGLPCCYDNETGFWDGCFYGMTGDGKFGLHQMGWLAYRRKPEEAEHGLQRAD